MTTLICSAIWMFLISFGGLQVRNLDRIEDVETLSQQIQGNRLDETTKKQLGTAGAPVSAVLDSFQRGTETLIETQKAAIEIAAKPFKSIASRN